MEKYTLLLVDDEEEAIQVIIRKINWEAIGFLVVGYASNGVKALELVEELQPDVVMTDIKMPYMDGIELAKQIKAEFPETKILFFTGFDEFEYAKEAVHLEVEEYILKPVNSMELSEVFTKLREKIAQEINEKRNVKLLQTYYMESLPLLQTNFYSTLLEGRVLESELSKYLSDYQISFEGPFFCCLVIHTSTRKVQEMPENMNPLLLSTSVQKLALERLGERRKTKCFSYLGNTVMIVELKMKNEVSELTDDCDRFCRYVRRIVGAVVTVGVGQVCENILELQNSYSSAKEAVSYRAIYGAGRAMNIREIAPQKTLKVSTENETELSNLFKMIRLNETEKIETAVDQYLKSSFFLEKSLQQHDINIMDLVGELYRFLSSNGIASEHVLGDMRKLCNMLFDLEPEALRRWLADISLTLCHKLANARNRTTKSFVLEAKEYVERNYPDEGLSLDGICEVLGVSNSYFSTIFKKETGKSFIGYVTDCRMEQAVRLLLETDEKNYRIAKKVGYADANYFSYVFKKQFGVSPLKYRMEHTKK